MNVIDGSNTQSSLDVRRYL